MKKLLLAVMAIAVTAGTAVAEGYQVNTFSARQEGMGHVGVALKLGAESNIFNPGALAFSDKTVDVTAGMSAIKSSVTANHNGTEYKTSNKVSTPFNISAASASTTTCMPAYPCTHPTAAASTGVTTGPAQCSTKVSTLRYSPYSPPCRGVFFLN